MKNFKSHTVTPTVHAFIQRLPRKKRQENTMEDLLRSRRLVHRTSVILVLGYLHALCCVSGIAMASGLLEDPKAKFVTPEMYFTNLRTFHGESLTAMSLSLDGSQLYLGGKNVFYILDLTQPFGRPEAALNISWVSTQVDVDGCTMKGKQSWQCQNFIQVVLVNNATNRLLVCGTNAWSPACRNYQPNSLTVYHQSSGTNRCPYSPTQKSTAIFADGALYSATVTSFTAVDSIIFRSMRGEPIRSKAVDTKWLKVPEFIKSFEVGEWVLFFFREIAVDAIYSRVAKVCKNDLGGSWVLEDTWTTFQKARLNCSFPGAFPFYFNYLQDVYMMGEGDDINFYGVFTTGDHEIPGSAVCVYSLAKIKEIINEGQFKKQQQGNWYPVPVDEVPDPRPGLCVENSKMTPDNTLNFILAHPLMHLSVPNEGEEWPRFDLTRANYRLMQIVVHQQKAINDKTYNVLFLGTDDGRVLKVVIVKGTNDRYRSNLLEEIFVSPRMQPEAVVNMEIVRQPGGDDVILVNTNSTVVELPLQRCDNLTECACKQDPYCVFNNFSQKCLRYTDNNFDSQDVENIQDCAKEVPVPQTTTPVECFCPTAQPCVKTGKDCEGDNPDNLSTTMLPPAVATVTSSRTPPPEAITTPKKGTTPRTIPGRTTPTPRRPQEAPTTPSDVDNEVIAKTTPPRNEAKTTRHPNAVGPLAGVTGEHWWFAPASPIFWTFFAVGWFLAFVLLAFLLHLFVNKKCKGYKPTPKIVQTVLATENGKPPLMTAMEESPVRPTPVNGILPQSRPHSLTPSVDPSPRNSNGSYRPPQGSFSYGMDGSYLAPYGGSTGGRRPPSGGGLPVELGSPQRLPSETESRPSASGASDTELCGDDSEIWLKRPDGSDFGQEHEV
ncbi:semaphorin-1A-like isoform X6 [Acanthaster planci]|uniref:Semaphorin-1A-like isoform X6 n=1 Tax=Acanthaster planci TaxID=133434 RepID=A0A8B7Z249_ACAPL|nr:semaphorin-1A-like isoform X6 [Acanthaster planci]